LSRLTSLSPLSFLLMLPRPPTSTLFPYTTLFRSLQPKIATLRLCGLAIKIPASATRPRCRALRVSRGSLRCGVRLFRRGRLSGRSEEHTSELQSRGHLVCRLLLEKKNTNRILHHM